MSPSKRPKRRPPAPRVVKRKRKTASTIALTSFEGTHRLLALDTSSVCSGWAVFDNGQLISSGQFVQVGEEHGEKLANFFSWLSQLMADWQPHDTVFELPFAGRRRFTYGVLSKYTGVVELTHFHRLGRELPAANKIPAHAVKRAIGVRKGASHDENKRLMVAEMNAIYGMALRYKANDRTKKITEDDRADAIAVGRAWLLKYHADWL